MTSILLYPPLHRSTGGASDKASEGGKKPSQKPPARSLSYKLSDILANPMMKSLVLKDPKTVEEVLLKVIDAVEFRFGVHLW